MTTERMTAETMTAETAETLRSEMTSARRYLANLEESLAIVEFLHRDGAVERSNGNGNGHGNGRHHPPTDDKAARRARTAAVLAAYDKPAPWTHGTAGLGTLIRHGFLRRQGRNVVRTAKPFAAV